MIDELCMIRSFVIPGGGGGGLGIVPALFYNIEKVALVGKKFRKIVILYNT